MTVRLRDRIENSAAQAPEESPVLHLLGLPKRRDLSSRDIAGLTDVALHGMRWAALCNLFALASIGYLGSATIGASGSKALYAILATAILLIDLLSNLPLTRKRLEAWSPATGVRLISGAGMISAASFAIIAGHLVTSSPISAAIAFGAIAGGCLATFGLPIAFIIRVGAAAIGFMACGHGHSTAFATLPTAAFGMAMAIIVRSRIQHNQGEEKKAGIYADLVSAYERSNSGWFWGTDTEGHLTYISPQLGKRLGSESENLIGSAFDSLFAKPKAAKFSDDQVERTVGFTLNAGLEFHDLIVRAATDEDRWWSLSGTPVLDSHGRCHGFLGSGTDLTAQRQSEAQATKLALYDGLTGLPNRVQIRTTLEDLLKQDGGRRPNCGLFLLDLDRFKNVNDTLGHPVGDELLKIVAQRLSRIVGSNGQVGRLGGDEFKVIVPDVIGRPQLAELADAIITRLSLPYVIGDCTIQIGATVGIAVAPTDGIDPDELTRNADLALYAGKAAGKGVHRFYQPEMHADADFKRALENELREVLTEKQLSLVYQPVVDAKNENITGFEALIRWNHPVRGMISPAIFIPIAEEVGLIGRIGDWVIRQACAQAVHWPEHLRIAVNLSPLQFTSATLPATLMNALAETGLAPERLELEITEGVFLQEDAATEQTFSALTKLGVRLVLDDFGTGYASLGYLKRVPFSKIKIDQSFVRGAEDKNSHNYAIMGAIVGLAKSLNMETVAEGAETLNEIALIRSLGCTQIQGYIFGQPMSAEEALARATAVESAPHEPGELVEREPRISLLRFATIRTDGHIHSVRIKNISTRGALIEASGDAAIGQSFELEIAEGWKVAGDVRWRQGNRFGVQFDSAIDVETFVKSGNSRPTQIAEAAAEEELDPIFDRRAGGRFRSN